MKKILIALIVFVGCALVYCSTQHKADESKVETKQYDLVDEVVKESDELQNQIVELTDNYDELAKAAYEEYGNGRSYEEFYEEFLDELFLETLQK